ncbi:Protein of unknown function [Pyronema omphalodes CBS 100304]|uniref:Uncharacterized protein n=1 Tax=Pyronema omphalodes (strain CBS 100304) TaxID=1076935 RepID=U4L5B8_PYROM|nr:Protein of unknown function [Pyronema omphalodes CBS 100304]
MQLRLWESRVPYPEPLTPIQVRGPRS